MKRLFLLIAGALVVVGATVLVLLWPHDPAPQPIAYANVSRNARICVTGTSTDESSKLWTAVQTAATHEPINAQRVIAPNRQPEQLIPFVNGLLALHCKLIITTGKDMHDAITSIAKANPNQTFATDDSTIALSNVHYITSPAELAKIIHALADGR